jgi:SAM-dependent methyltransferase
MQVISEGQHGKSVSAAPQLPYDKRRVASSSFWSGLWAHYTAAPSIALCRVPELEYAATLPVNLRFLDHCCGDGKFAELAWPGVKLTAGCDISERDILTARDRGNYASADVCDASKALPYADQSFDVIFNNSALEHIVDLDNTLAEVGRVLAPGGVFAFNVLNHRYFEWWPLSAADKAGYRDWQPFYHAFSIEEWTRRLKAVGLEVESVQGYFDKSASQLLAKLDCEFSGKYCANRESAFYDRYVRHPKLMQWLYRMLCGKSIWQTRADEGAGYFIQARKAK